MSHTVIDYYDLAKRSINQPLLAIYACCPNCGGDIGVHKGFAKLLDLLYATGVKFCEYQGLDCLNAPDAREWVWTRYFSSKGKIVCVDDIEIPAEPALFEIAA